MTSNSNTHETKVHMIRFDQIVRQAVDDGVAPFLCAAIAGRDGVRWQGAAGRTTPNRDADADTVFRLFSATKAIGSMAALIAIDRGLLAMDTPAGDIVPAFDELQVLEAITADGPVFRRPRTRATLRHLLTHMQGQSYDIFSPLMLAYARQTGLPGDVTGLWESLKYPLLFDPGEGFAYGIGTDWVGHLVATVAGRPIEHFVADEILEPLGMRSTVFETDGVRDRVADVSLKTAAGGFIPIEHGPPSRPEFYHMGNALYSTPTDYLRFLRCILNNGELDGRRLVAPETMRLAYTDQTGGVKVPSPVLTSLRPDICLDVDILPETAFTHTAVSFMNLNDVPGRRSAGSLSWGGVLHTLYWVDPHKDVAGVFFTQMLPFWDPSLNGVFETFERAAYDELAR
jgi:CubicO group peptidase (beta-lactamase class C family)